MKERNEADVLAEILVWSTDCPMWQRDVLRRLCTKGELEEMDLDELTALCKAKGGGGDPLSADHIPDPQAATTVAELRSVHDVENVNALKAGEQLTFGKTGVTVVYGDNGSGKSGYARILKKVCRARSPKRDDILPNIYASKMGAQKAVIDYRANGQNKVARWATGASTDALLSSISVFDSSTANVHVDAVNDVAYTPFPMSVLERLAGACQEVKKRINAEVRELQQKTPAAIAQPKCRSGTAVGQLIGRLSGETDESRVRELSILSEGEKTRFETLKVDLSKEPAKVARQLETLYERLNGIDRAFKKLEKATSRQTADQLWALSRELQTARVASATAANDLFAGEPLADVGSDVWRALWEAARAYSEREAYPDQLFPVIGDGARCVLCQQELGPDAAERVARFERFVKDETKKREDDAREKYQAELASLNAVSLSAGDLRSAVTLVRDDLNDEELSPKVRATLITAKWRLRSLLRNHTKGGRGESLPSVADWPADRIKEHRDAIEARISALRAEDESAERRRLIAEYEELVDREWLAVVQDDVIAEILLS